MKNVLLFTLFLIGASFTASAQMIEMTPYDVKTDPSDMRDDFQSNGFPIELNCKIETCPDLLKAVGHNVFMVNDGRTQSIKIAKSILKRLKKDRKLIGFYKNNKVCLYKKKKGKVGCK